MITAKPLPKGRAPPRTFTVTECDSWHRRYDRARAKMFRNLRSRCMIRHDSNNAPSSNSYQVPASNDRGICASKERVRVRR